MKYVVKYSLEINVHEIITDFMREDGIVIPEVGSSESKRPKQVFALAEFDNIDEAVVFTEYFSRNNCHTKLKSGLWYGSYITIQDYQLYEGVWIDEVKE